MQGVCAKQGVFGVGKFNCASKICLTPTPVTMATKIRKFQQKIGYNLACIRGTSSIFVQTRVVGVGEFICASKICLRPTHVTIVTKIRQLLGLLSLMPSNWHFRAKLHRIKPLRPYASDMMHNIYIFRFITLSLLLMIFLH